MRYEKIVAALFAVGVGVIPLLATVSAESLQQPLNRRKRRQVLSNNGIDPLVTLPRARALGLDSIKYGPKKAKIDKGGSSSSRESKGSNNHDDYDDDDDEVESGGKGRAPPKDDIHPTQTERPNTKESKREKKPKYESRKDKESKLEKSSKASPTHKPFPAPSVDVSPEPTRAPSIDVPTPPAPGPTLPPANENLRVLSPYQLVYTLSEYSVPFRSELLEVVEVTRLYLDDFFGDEFQDDGDLLKLLTIFLDTSFDFGVPIPIEYESSAVFDPDQSSASLPAVEDLDAVLFRAFQGENLEGYIGMLQALPTSNQFSKTIDVEITEPSIGDSLVDQNTSATRDLTTATVAMAGTSGLLLILAGAVLMRRNSDDGENDDDSEDEDSITGAKPCNTIGGETATTAADWSLDQMAVPIIVRPYGSDTKKHVLEDAAAAADYHESKSAEDDVSSLCHPLSHRGNRTQLQR